MTKGFDPYNFWAFLCADSASGRATQEIQSPDSRNMERIHEIQRPIRIHRGPQRDRRRTFSNADFNQALTSTSVFLQGPVFRSCVLRNRWPQSGPSEERV